MQERTCSSLHFWRLLDSSPSSSLQACCRCLRAASRSPHCTDTHPQVNRPRTRDALPLSCEGIGRVTWGGELVLSLGLDMRQNLKIDVRKWYECLPYAPLLQALGAYCPPIYWPPPPVQCL